MRNRWRDYRTPSGDRPVFDFIAARSLEDRAEIAAAMRDVRDRGLRSPATFVPRFTRSGASGVDESYRLLFAQDGRKGRILLALVAFSKKIQTAADPGFPLVEAAVAQRELLRRLDRRRVQLGLSQAQIAEQMGTSQPAVARLESGEVDARVSTIERFAGAVGARLEYRLVVPVRRAATRRARTPSVRA